MTPQPDHPLLTKVLGDALRTKNGPQPTERFAGQLLAAIPPDIADRLEAALDVCAVCGFTQWSYVPREGPAIRTHPMGDGHPYQPLVTP